MWGWLLVSLYTLLRCVQNNSINLSVLHTKRMKSFINCKESNRIRVLCRMSLMTACIRPYPHSVNHNLRRRRIAFRLNLLLRSSDKSLYILGTIHRAQTGYDKVLWSRMTTREGHRAALVVVTSDWSAEIMRMHLQWLSNHRHNNGTSSSPASEW